MIKEIKMRGSIRKYIDKPVKKEKTIQLLENERLALYDIAIQYLPVITYKGR